MNHTLHVERSEKNICFDVRAPFVTLCHHIYTHNLETTTKVHETLKASISWRCEPAILSVDIVRCEGVPRGKGRPSVVELEDACPDARCFRFLAERFDWLKLASTSPGRLRGSHSLSFGLSYSQFAQDICSECYPTAQPIEGRIAVLAALNDSTSLATRSFAGITWHNGRGSRENEEGNMREVHDSECSLKN